MDDGGDFSEFDDLIHDFMLCHDKIVLLFVEANISSGMGTSRTVSRPSSRSKLGQSFLM